MGPAGDAAARWRAREALIVVAGVSAVIAVIVGLLAVTVLPPVLAPLVPSLLADTPVVPVVSTGVARRCRLVPNDNNYDRTCVVWDQTAPSSTQLCGRLLASMFRQAG